MMIRFNLLYGFLLSLVVLLGACASKPTTVDTQDESSMSGSMSDSAESESYGMTGSQIDSQSDKISAAQSEEKLRSKKIFYFDFDQSIIKPEAYAALKAHARYMRQNPDTRVRLEGHADERGTREYNLALGERRAQSVAKFLKINGVAASQVSTVTYGEEQPAADGHDEAAWRLNRRVEFKYIIP